MKETSNIETVQQLTVDDFKNVDEFNEFLNHTKQIPQRRIPKIPFSTLGEYLEEYNKIMSKESILTPAQRIRIKNVIHIYARKGDIRLSFK